MVLAHGAALQRGRHVLRVAELRYDLQQTPGPPSSPGMPRASPSPARRSKPRRSRLTRPSCRCNPTRTASWTSPTAASSSSARAITADPGDQIQFRRATIYSDGKKLLSVAYHVMPMNTDQIFGQQLLGFGSDGVFLNVPYYYNVTPHSKGTIYLRNAAVSGANLGSSLSSGRLVLRQPRRPARHGAGPGTVL